jgi:Zn-dependent M28 family amino/carboxypeptidase
VYQGGKPARTIRLALFNLEEVGLVGSSAYAHDWVVKNRRTSEPGAPVPEKIVGMISLEMLGFYSDEPGSQKSPIPRIEGVFEPSTVGDSIAMVGIKANQGFSRELMRRMIAHAAELKVTAVDFMPVAIPDMMRSDHQPFLVAGAPAVMLTDTANFRNPNYHKATDTVDTLDAKRFTLTVKAIAGAVWSMADAK